MDGACHDRASGEPGPVVSLPLPRGRAVEPKDVAGW